MLQKFTVRLFTIIFLPLVACQLPGGQAAQPGELPTPVPTALPSAEPTPTPIEGDSVEFETVVKGGCSLQKEEISLISLTSQGDIINIQDQVEQAVINQIQNVNFDNDIVIALFQGLKPTDNYQVVIDRIFQKEQKLIVHAQLWEPNPQWESAAVLTSPCHIVKISRQYIHSQPLELLLQTITITPTPPAP